MNLLLIYGLILLLCTNIHYIYLFILDTCIQLSNCYEIYINSNINCKSNTCTGEIQSPYEFLT